MSKFGLVGLTSCNESSNCNTVHILGLRIFFSYSVVVAFMDVDHMLVMSNAYYGTTTARHKRTIKKSHEQHMREVSEDQMWALLRNALAKILSPDLELIAALQNVTSTEDAIGIARAKVE